MPSNAHRRYRISYPGKVRALGSIAAAVAYVARGNAVGALLGRPSLWDIAATGAMLARAGGELRTLKSGELVDYAQMLRRPLAAEPVVAGSPAAVALLRQMIRLRP